MDSTAEDQSGQDSEIRKLQELVKKLELQNQSLIERHNLETDAAAGPDSPDSPADQSPIQALRRLNGIKSTHDTTTTTTRQKDGDGSKGSKKPDTSRLSLDCFGLIDVDGISLDADDSWLYKSPKQTPGCETVKSPFLWVREEFDQSGDDTSSFRRSLFYKLDEVTRNIDFETAFWAQKTDSKAIEDSPMELSLADDKDVFSEFTGVSSLGKADDARVSAVSRGIEPLLGNDLNDDDTVSPKLNPLIRPSLLTGKDRRVSESAISDAGYRAVSSASEENLLGAKYKCVDVADIKMLAKMQEESLRMSYNVPLGSSKKLLSKSLNRSSGTLVDSCDSLLANTALSKDSRGLNNSTGALLETTNFRISENIVSRPGKTKLSNENRVVSRSSASLAPPMTRNTAVRSGFQKTANSHSLPGTPYGSNQELSKQSLSTLSNAVPHRQSLPSLNRGLKLSVLKSHPSDSRLASAGKKPLSLVRQPASSSTLSQAASIRGAKVVTPIKPKSGTAIATGNRTSSTSAGSRNAVTAPLATTKSRPTTLSNSEAKPIRAVATTGRIAPGSTAPGLLTPTSKSKPLTVGSNKPTTPSALPHASGIPKPGSLTKLSIPCKTITQTGHVTTAANDDDDWKEGCF